eukprot:1400604-Prymnesium_polylepis.1
MPRTCRSRNSDRPCVNCVFFRRRRKCLNLTYEYYLRPIGNADPQSIDECLAHLLGHKPNCTRGRWRPHGAGRMRVATCARRRNGWRRGRRGGGRRRRGREGDGRERARRRRWTRREAADSAVFFEGVGVVAVPHEEMAGA